jgi:uncharacterized protein (TIGR03083 family)
MADYALPPIITAHLFADLDSRLIDLLESLTADEWQRATVVPKWNVKQITAHLLDTALRRLSLVRDRIASSTSPGGTERELTDFINMLNAEGVEVYGRLSPRVLVSLMQVAVRDLHEHLIGLDPMAPAMFAVSWAGDERSLNWFDTARELTERWHHQQQIRLAVDRPGIMTPQLYRPVLDCFMRGLPYAYRSVAASNGDVAEILILGDCGGTWRLQKGGDGWSLVADGATGRVVARTRIPQEIAWQIFTKSFPPQKSRALVSIDGNEAIGSAVLGMTAIVG